jgi:hypothetical protein
MQKFRRENKRVDYYPMPDAVAAIERLRQHYPDAPTRALIDMLVMAGIKALTAKVTP